MLESDRQLNVTNYNAMKGFLDLLKENGLATKPEWTPNEALQIQLMSSLVGMALPSSIRSITFPNGGKAILGNEVDSNRVANWDLTDIKKFAEHLASTIKL